MTIERITNGGYRLSTIHNGCLVSKVYIGYTKKEALRLFRGYLKEVKF